MAKLYLSVVIACVFTVSACAGTEIISKEKHKEKPVALPENVVKAANGTLFVALSTPVSGCQAYRQYAPSGQMVIQVIYYQHRGKVFSPVREGAICN